LHRTRRVHAAAGCCIAGRKRSGGLEVSTFALNQRRPADERARRGADGTAAST
jgi:hypothetical protein